jgi:Bacterial antitoxin of type II TA system, VapB
MRTTINIDDAVLARAKERAHEDRRALGSVIEAALQTYLLRGADSSPLPVDLPVSGRGGGVRPGVDLSSNRSMFEVLDSDERTEPTA